MSTRFNQCFLKKIVRYKGEIMNSILVVEDDLHISNLLDETLSNRFVDRFPTFWGDVV